MRKWQAILLAVMTVTAAARAERIKDITTIKGVRSNPIFGLGLVVGLSGTGDGSEITKRALASLLRKHVGMAVSPTDISTKNVAYVWVTAQLPAFAERGSKIDVTVSAIGSAESLRNGTLLLTELKGADGTVYAVAQGAINVAGFSATGKAASITKGHLTVGRIIDGAHVERAEISEFVENGRITLLLRNPDFATAQRIAAAVNGLYPRSAVARNSTAVRVTVPKDLKKEDLVTFVERISAGNIKVDSAAVVVINEKTGTIVMGQNVRITMVSLAHGNLSIIKEEKEKVSQPNAFSKGGKSVKVDRSKINANEANGYMRTIPATVTVADLAQSLNGLGLAPSDLIAVFQALKAKGALQAELRAM